MGQSQTHDCHPGGKSCVTFTKLQRPFPQHNQSNEDPVHDDRMNGHEALWGGGAMPKGTFSVPYGTSWHEDRLLLAYSCGFTAF